MNFSGQRPDGSHALSLPAGEDTLQDRFFGQSSLATHAIAHESNVVKMRKDAPLVAADAASGATIKPILRID